MCMRRKNTLFFASYFVFLTSLTTYPSLAMANTLSLDDYKRLRPITLQMSAVSEDLANLIIKPPMKRGALDAIASGNRTQECIIRLTGAFSVIETMLNSLAQLVAISARMINNEDEFILLQFVKLNAGGFVDQLGPHRQMLESTQLRCADDGATIAKGQEISRVYKDAEAAVRLIIQKVDFIPLR